MRSGLNEGALRCRILWMFRWSVASRYVNQIAPAINPITAHAQNEERHP